jgi:hypothetical protein
MGRMPRGPNHPIRPPIIYSELEKLRQRLALLEMEITRAKIGIAAGRVLQSELDELVEDRYLVAERLAVIEDDANG